MQQHVLLDTGPLVAFLNHRDRWHQWTLEPWSTIKPPLLTCEAVITESCFLLRQLYGGRDAVMALLDRQVIQIDFDLSQEIDSVRRLIAQYESVPMSLADACLVRMSEQKVSRTILTLDSDFRIYRKNRDQIIRINIPD